MLYLTFFLGFVLLIKGADLFVDGASALAKSFRISDLVIGLTIVAFGSSAPEFVVNVIASIDGSTGLVFGNILGSNISNIALILGLASILSPIAAKPSTIYREIPFLILATIILIIMANDEWLNNESVSVLSRSEGLILLGFFSIFVYYVISISHDELEYISPMMPVWKSIVFILIGIGGLILGAEWIVKGAIVIAKIIGMSEAVIGLTIVGVGTSLPELATTLVAVKKKNADLAIGSIVGSNIFNIFWVLGVSASICPLVIEPKENIDMLVGIIFSVLLYICFFIDRKQLLQRSQGAFFLFFYIIYMIYLFVYRTN